MQDMYQWLLLNFGTSKVNTHVVHKYGELAAKVQAVGEQTLKHDHHDVFIKHCVAHSLQSRNGDVQRIQWRSHPSNGAAAHLRVALNHYVQPSQDLPERHALTTLSVGHPWFAAVLHLPVPVVQPSATMCIMCKRGTLPSITEASMPTGHFHPAV